ncbi:MAG: hypothetical protein JSV04_13895 [Candidatus Heimdallarchaeota archaeon]|nr:MAG: hypothetical protein JSV04_13895 [Candidatus Heimdallarchaeota archaeon]
MAVNSYFQHPPFNAFPFKNFLQVIDKMEYLGENEEFSPYEVSPGTDLCISDTYYSLRFLVYLHSFGRVTQDGNKWFITPNSKGEIPTEKPHRYSLIADAVEILQALAKGNKTTDEIKPSVSDLADQTISDYLNVLRLLTQKGKIEQRSSGWDATFVLTEWDK